MRVAGVGRGRAALGAAFALGMLACYVLLLCAGSLRAGPAAGERGADRGVDHSRALSSCVQLTRDGDWAAAGGEALGEGGDHEAGAHHRKHGAGHSEGGSESESKRPKSPLAVFLQGRVPPLLACAQSSEQEVSATGGWCLEAEPGQWLAPGRPLAKQHVPADDGVAATVLEVVRRDSVVDIGAGIGQYALWFAGQNASMGRYLAFDGAPNVEAFTLGLVRYLDVSQRVSWLPHEVSDWALSLEVGEHIPRAYEDVYLDNLHRANRKGVILSWALPGQLGHHHVNERPNLWVMDKMQRLGYSFDRTASARGRKRASYFWFQGTFMVFRRVAS